MARIYKYENTSYKKYLTGVVDENGGRYSTYAYDAYGKAISTELAGGVSKWTVGIDSMTGKMKVTDPLGNIALRTFSTVQGVVKLASSDTPCTACAGPVSQAATYDTNGNVASRTDFNNKKTCIASD